jgi:hypothetical protein
MMHLPQWCALLAVGLLATACKRQAADGGGPLPPADSSLQARDSIQHPFDEIAPGVFSRVVYRTPPSVGPDVEVRDIELAQGKAVAALTFPGAAVIEVRNGKAGGTFGLSQGDSLQLANKEAGPLSLRVYVIGSR